MDCDKCKIQLHAYLDGELEGQAFAEVEHHVGQCPDCKTELDRLVKMRELLQELKKVEVPEGEREIFIGALRDRLLSEGATEYRKRADLRPYLIAAIAVVVILIVMVSIPKKEKPLRLGPGPGLNAMQNAVVDGIIATGLDDHFLTTSGDFLSDPGVSGGEIIAVWKVVRETHRDLFMPLEPSE